MIGVKSKKLQIIRRKPGFSLIELIVSLSVITLLTGLFLANYHNANRRTDLTMTAQALVTDIRYAQANALGLIKYDGAVPAGGWGVYFSGGGMGNSSNTSYVIFADENDDRLYQAGEGEENLGGRLVDLPPNIVIDRIMVGGSQNARAAVTFLPPDPLTRIRGSSGTSTFLEIRLREKLNDTTKTVRVNFLGLVEVID
jgi:prepilin-type N-terminal cleavage/methylation domain-containing protein